MSDLSLQNQCIINRSGDEKEEYINKWILFDVNLDSQTCISLRVRVYRVISTFKFFSHILHDGGLTYVFLLKFCARKWRASGQTKSIPVRMPDT